MNHWMFRCQDVSQKVSLSMDTPLPLHQRMAVRIHLWMCRYCTLFARQLRMLRSMSRHMEDKPPEDKDAVGLSPEAKERMKQQLRKM